MGEDYVAEAKDKVPRQLKIRRIKRLKIKRLISGLNNTSLSKNKKDSKKNQLRGKTHLKKIIQKILILISSLPKIKTKHLRIQPVKRKEVQQQVKPMGQVKVRKYFQSHRLTLMLMKG